MIKDLRNKLLEREEKISKAKKVRTLITKQKGLLKKKQATVDFEEPILFLYRRNGIIDMFEKATAGRFVFLHSNGEQRFIELRPSDQGTMPYGEKRIRTYVAHEDRPYAGWDSPVVDSSEVMTGYQKTKATDLKYEERIQSLKNKGKMTWVYIIVGIAIAVAIVGFAYMTWIEPALTKRDLATASIQGAPPIAGIIWLNLKKVANYKKKRRLQLKW